MCWRERGGQRPTPCAHAHVLMQAVRAGPAHPLTCLYRAIGLGAHAGVMGFNVLR